MNIKSTFLHLNHFGQKTEKMLWSKNIFTWDDYQLFEQKNNLFFHSSNSILEESFTAFKTNDIDFFTSKLPKSEYYRLALTFPDDVIFLDIETTGLSQYYDHITMVGWTIGNQYDYFINGISDIKKLSEALSKAKIIVTFNGTIFDIPFLKNQFPMLEMPSCHIDLRFFAKKAELSGGQKSIEEQLGVKRKKGLQQTDGYQATVLWDEYKWGKKTSLEKLIAYNHADVEGMKTILDYSIQYIFKKENYKKIFPAPFKFTSKKSKLNTKGIKDFVQTSPIPFNPKATLKYQKLAAKINKNIKIVGIDLTGSEQKAAGMAFLHNDFVETSLIKSNDDIINSIIKFAPDIVSIDSPLSLPLGRISVFDDDPGRDEFGIMRICERVLKKRGVNAYPTLLPSMQKLTKRGIELADRLRKLGIPVIESYPGAIQDIIGLPRKQASLDLLKKGLGIFGLKGKFLTTNTSHDEIDAITSAIVGIFFLSGDYEPIGDLRENYMIIPDLHSENKKKTVIGLCGEIASGKTTVAQMIEKNSFQYASYSQFLKDTLLQQEKPINRENLQKLGIEFHENQTEFSKKVYETIQQFDHIVIDGLRHPEDYAFFFETYGFNFRLLYLQADYEQREERYRIKGFTADEFKLATSHLSEVNIPLLKPIAYKIIENNGTHTALEEKIKEILTEMK